MTNPAPVIFPTQSAVNNLGQPIGFPMPEWAPVTRPAKTTMTGKYCRLEPLAPNRHTTDLYKAFQQDHEQRIWTYLPYGPFQSIEEYQTWVQSVYLGEDPLFFAIIDATTGRATGVCSYLRIDPKVGSIEVGHLAYAPVLQKTPAATEAMFLMMRAAFDLGYRRYEWKCDALNQPSRAAAERLGFQYEGLFRQATIYKQRNRDTTWYSILDTEWPRLRDAFTQWLAPENFDAAGQQKRRLSDFQ